MVLNSLLTTACGDIWCTHRGSCHVPNSWWGAWHVVGGGSCCWGGDGAVFRHCRAVLVRVVCHDLQRNVHDINFHCCSLSLSGSCVMTCNTTCTIIKIKSKNLAERNKSSPVLAKAVARAWLNHKHTHNTRICTPYLTLISTGMRG